MSGFLMLELFIYFSSHPFCGHVGFKHMGNNNSIALSEACHQSRMMDTFFPHNGLQVTEPGMQRCFPLLHLKSFTSQSFQKF